MLPFLKRQFQKLPKLFYARSLLASVISGDCARTGTVAQSNHKMVSEQLKNLFEFILQLINLRIYSFPTVKLVSGVDG